MTTHIDVAQQKRRLILSPILCLFFGVLAYLTAPSGLAFGIGVGAGVLLAPLAAKIINQSERGKVSASATVGGVGAVVMTVVLQVVLPDDPIVMFALSVFSLALLIGLGISAAGRLRRHGPCG